MWSVKVPAHSKLVTDLTDDVLQYIKPSLQAYHGCDIIDLHPGACLWSQKLHQLLEPRRHLLMEPDCRYHVPFVKPLLDLPGSKYRYTNISGAHPKSYWSAYDHIFNDELLPRRPALAANEPCLRRPDHKLLITGYLHRAYPELRSTNNSVNHTSLILNHMVHAAQTNSMFHTNGLVRMLFWVPELTRDLVFPSALFAKSPYNFALDMVSRMDEVAGPLRRVSEVDIVDRRQRHNKARPQVVERKSHALCLDRMTETGIVVPNARRSAAPSDTDKDGAESTTPIDNADGQVAAKPSSDTSTDLNANVASLTKDIAAFHRALSNRKRKSRTQNYAVPITYTFPPETTKLWPEHATPRYLAFANLTIRQIAAEEQLCALGGESQLSISLRQDLLTSAASLRDCKEHVGTSADIANVLDVLEEERGLRYDPPLLPRDRRPYEPLVVRTDEFYPRRPLHLLNICPRSETQESDITSAAEGNSVMRELAQTIFMREREPLPKALDRVGPNAGRDLVAATPMLTDVRRGGRLDVMDLPVRMLTTEMFDALVTAFLEWPFRPTTAELAVSLAKTDKPLDD